MQKESSDKTIERRAKSLLLSRDIPSDKMKVVRTLLNNKNLLTNEKYSAIIEIIQSCPEKSAKSLSTTKATGQTQQSAPSTSQEFVPLDSITNVDSIFRKYKRLKIFRKRHLIHSNNRLGIGLYKRLIPNRRLIKALKDLVGFHEKILSRLQTILMIILKDQSIDDATDFNFLRIFRKWMMETPVVKYSYEDIKWMDKRFFETELQSYCSYFFSFLRLDAEIRERLLLLVENKLREIDDLAKEVIKEDDSISVKGQKEKRNLAKEKAIYEYMTIMRSFLPSSINSESVISNHLKVEYKINSLPEFLLILIEALVFQRDVNLNEIMSYYDIKAPVVDGENWDYSYDYLKEIGKDAESRKIRMLERLKEEILPYDELKSLLKLQIEGQSVLNKAFENQWKIADKKQKEHSHIFESNFFTFLDECINSFNNSFVPFLNGTKIQFEDKFGNCIEGVFFTRGYFANELKTLSNLLSEIHLFRSNNPRMVISRAEAMRIVNGEIRSMAHIERFILLIGDLFYQIGEELHHIYGLHKIWKQNQSKIINMDLVKTPLDRDIQKELENGRPVPFYNYRVTGFHDNRILTKQLLGKSVLTDNLKGGIFIHIIALSYQIANACMHESIFQRLDKRKEILREIKNLEE